MRRYGLATALLYDVFSGERPFYRTGRTVAVDALALQRGDRVLVLGSGTGLDLPVIADAIGPDGTIIAVDDSAVMLRRSARRLRDRRGRRRSDRPAIRLVLADLTRARAVLPPGEAPVDAVLAVNTLSLIPAWRRAWATGVAAARPGARGAIADIARPAPGRPLLTGWARWISFVGLGDLDAHPWTVLDEGPDGPDVVRSFHAGHVQVRSGVLR